MDCLIPSNYKNDFIVIQNKKSKSIMNSTFPLIKETINNNNQESFDFIMNIINNLKDNYKMVIDIQNDSIEIEKFVYGTILIIRNRQQTNNIKYLFSLIYNGWNEFAPDNTIQYKILEGDLKNAIQLLCQSNQELFDPITKEVIFQVKKYS